MAGERAEVSSLQSGQRDRTGREQEHEPRLADETNVGRGPRPARQSEPGTGMDRRHDPGLRRTKRNLEPPRSPSFAASPVTRSPTTAPDVPRSIQVEEICVVHATLPKATPDAQTSISSFARSRPHGLRKKSSAANRSADGAPPPGATTIPLSSPRR